MSAKTRLDGGSWPLVCEHCGTPERPGNPVHSYDKDGQTYLLHPAYWTEWLAGSDPDGWSFNLDDQALPLVCEHCGAAERPEKPLRSIYWNNVNGYCWVHPACHERWLIGDSEDAPEAGR
jgi:hypothetical protein